MNSIPFVTCPKCKGNAEISSVLTAQSNQNVIYECPKCAYIVSNIVTSKG
jgi:predicted RNA-binding Zn-ribbon protein involved in translation (DUF1610 family)